MSGTGTNSATSTGTTANSATASGYDRPLAELLMEYRKTFLNVDMKVIGELQELFCGVY
jgi:hypothetical protein